MKSHIYPDAPSSPLDRIRVRQQAIGVRLRFEFDHIVAMPVPPEWLELLRKADERASAPGVLVR